MTDHIAFAAERGERTDRAIDRLGPLAAAWLESFGSDAALGDLVDAATDVWLETFEATAPEAYIDAVVGDFRDLIGEALSRTTEPASPPEPSQVKRVATYLATVATNDATWQAFQATGGVRMRWVSRRDERTRTTHRAASGQVRRVLGTFDVGGAQLRYPGDPKGPIEETIECRCVLAPAGRVQRRTGMTASADDFDDRPWALVALLPADEDVNAASSEEIAHMTFIWFGEPTDTFDLQSIAMDVKQYARETTPITVPVTERGELGDDAADVLFLESTDSLLALRDGLMDHPAIREAYDAVEQYPEWTPHVTLGYPEAPATAEYAGEQITFDRFAVWVGDTRMEFPMGQAVAASAAVDVEIEDPEAEVPEDVDIEDEEFVDDPLLEVPVHGVATVEGIPTGDGRGFRYGATVIPPLPAPLGFEYEYGHGGDNSKAVVVGRIDEMWREDLGNGTAEVRYRGVVMPSKPYANLALEGIADGSLNGVSVKIDSVTMDLTEERAAMRERLLSEEGMDMDAQITEENVDAFIEQFFGDGTQPITWFSEMRPRNFDIVHMPAFVEGFIGFGHVFESDLSDEDRAALTACGCYQPEEGDDASVIRGEDAFREVDTDERKRLADEGKAMPDGSFPIANEEDLRNAIQAIGRAKDPEAAKRHIKKRAADLGKSDLIPEDWSAEAIAASAAFAPGTKDGPGWITHPRATARIRRYWVSGKGAAKIKWGVPGDFNRCRSQLAKYVQNPDWLAGLCANMHYEALGFWPAQHHGARAIAASGSVAERAPLFVLIEEDEPTAIVAGAGSDWPEHFPTAAFRNPNLTEETPITFTPDGRVFGHLATWTACHVGMDGFCQNPPVSKSGYSHFQKGVLDTEDGPIRVGTLTYGIGHAALNATKEAAVRHYDKPNAVRAYVATGEDAIGIWFAGVVKPGLTRKQIGEFKALGAVSGDWRYVGRELELIGVTAVNVPGFQIARQALVAAAGGHQTALIPPPVVRHPNAKVQGDTFTLEQTAAIARAAAREALAMQRDTARLSAVRAVAAQVRADKIKAVREHAPKGA